MGRFDQGLGFKRAFLVKLLEDSAGSGSSPRGAGLERLDGLRVELLLGVREITPRSDWPW
jgi:hypothetical protein